jgi:transcriptional regulator with XRE-family HTH domain
VIRTNMMSSIAVAANRRPQLREFLIARRAARTPEAAGFRSDGRRRRTPGLRREEVAAIAGVGLSWYTWLEQGREINVSAQMLTRVATALSLTPTDTAYLFALAGVMASEPALERIATDVLQAAVDDCRGPAFVVSACWDVEAHNTPADRVFAFDAVTGVFARNHFWRLFMDSARRAIYVDWEEAARGSVGYLRTVSVTRAGESRADALIAELMEKSKEFARIWQDQSTAALTPMTIPLRLPRIGRIDFTSLRLQFPGLDGRVLVHLLPANEMSVRALQKLRGVADKKRKR